MGKGMHPRVPYIRDIRQRGVVRRPIDELVRNWYKNSIKTDNGYQQYNSLQLC